MTAPTEKAAPIPAEVRATADAIAATWHLLSYPSKVVLSDDIANAIMQDRASQEERIREDEREALALTDGELPALPHPALDGAFSAIQMRWYARTAVMADRARQRGDAS